MLHPPHAAAIHSPSCLALSNPSWLHKLWSSEEGLHQLVALAQDAPKGMPFSVVVPRLMWL